jgi:hypothetical protein
MLVFYNLLPDDGISWPETYRSFVKLNLVVFNYKKKMGSEQAISPRPSV